ncbi:MAG: hypothetical protein K2X48_06380 [Chitinophagaceae bacterium]|nr:hypothetical protein [Chitinophagaceae bacterium]
MKNKILYTCLCFVLLSAQCKKSKQPKTDTPGLPPATQTGANTFGFLLNGQPWIPQGNNGSGNNLSINYDPGMSFGTFSIAAYKVIPSAVNDNFIGLGIDSLNFYKEGHIYILTKDAGFRAGLDINNCFMMSNISVVSSSGFLYLDKYDKVNRIIAGRFELNISGSCGNFTWTKGRFDFKF